MNKILFAILLLYMLASCKSGTKQPAQVSAATKPDPTQSLIQNIKPIIQGVWVKQDYIQKVIQTKSPIQATDKVTGITTMHINPTQIDGDSLVVRVGYDNYQPGDVILRLRPGKNKAAFLFGENELGYSTQNNDTTLVLYQYYNKQWVLTPYVKALKQSTGNDLQEGINYLINKGLIAGNYTLKDSTGKVIDILFKDDGTVSGLSNFKRYFVENSFQSKKMNNLDQLTFNIFSSDEKTYTFKIEKNNLNLYEVKANANSTLLLKGKLKYQLLRKPGK